MTKVLVDRNGVIDSKHTELFQKIINYCEKNYKLRLTDIRAHILPLDQLSEMVATSGFTRAPQTWQLMQEYLKIKRQKELGNITIFEMVSAAGGILTKKMKH